MPTHIQVSTAWLADRLRATAARIRTAPTVAEIANAVDQLATHLDAVVCYPPPTPYGALPPPTTTTASTSTPELWDRQVLAQALLDTRQALRRQPLEPTVDDLLDVLWGRLQTGSVPIRSMTADPDWIKPNGACDPDRCPLAHDDRIHTHLDGRISWS